MKLLNVKKNILLNLASELERKIVACTKDLEIAKQEPEKAQKAEQIFLSNMSHEIRTPLNAIIGMTHLLNETKLVKAQVEYLEVLHSSSSILQKLITNILDFSKIDAGKVEVNKTALNLKKTVQKYLQHF